MKVKNKVKAKVSSNQVKAGSQFIIQVQVEPQVRIKVKMKDWVRLEVKINNRGQVGVRSRSKVRSVLMTRSAIKNETEQKLGPNQMSIHRMKKLWHMRTMECSSTIKKAII